MSKGSSLSSGGLPIISGKNNHNDELEHHNDDTTTSNNPNNNDDMMMSGTKARNRQVQSSSSFASAPTLKSTTKTSLATPRNPFYERERNNFPDFEIALKPGSPSLHHDGGEDVDQSICSQEGSSIMNMSIGARAALNDHLRYVAKYGIDGEKENNTSMASGSTNRNNDDAEEDDDDDDEGRQLFSEGTNYANNILDEHWETLLNSSLRVNSSSETGSGSGIPAPPSGISSSIHCKLYSSNNSPENSTAVDLVAATEDSIEVMTDVSHDFFNSSRVNVLKTPERNKNRRLDMVVTRDSIPPIDAPFGDNSLFDSDEYHDDDDDDHHHQHHHRREGDAADERNTSLHSFNPGDISRISTAGSDTRRSPEESFLSQDHHLEIDESALSPILDRSGQFSPFRPIRHENPSSFLPRLSTERDASSFEDHGMLFAKSYPMMSPPSDISGIRPTMKSTSDPTLKEKKSSPDNSSGSSKNNTSSSMQSTMSSIIEEAKSMVQHVANELEQSFGAFESLQADFLRAMDIGSTNDSRTDVPSPISQVESNSSSNESTKRKITVDRGDEDDAKRLVMTKNPTRSSGGVHSSPTAAIQLHGRKRFRTVVPRRVLLGSSDHAEDEQDSFLAVRSNPETRRPGEDVSLFESFDASVLRTTI